MRDNNPKTTRISSAFSIIKNMLQIKMQPKKEEPTMMYQFPKEDIYIKYSPADLTKNGILKVQNTLNASNSPMSIEKKRTKKDRTHQNKETKRRNTQLKLGMMHDHPFNI